MPKSCSKKIDNIRLDETTKKAKAMPFVLQNYKLLKLLKLKPWLSFLRFPNLLIVALTQYLMRYCTLYLFTDSPIFTEFDFFIMVLATVIIAAGGYIINDIYDYPIDKINKPEKTFINSLISERNAYWLYILMNFLVVLSGIYFYIRTGWKAAYLYPIVGISMLWLYSYKLKKSVLLGNLTVALFCAFVPFMVYVPEATVAFPEYELLRNFQVGTTNIMYNIFAAYAAFAFLSTFYREIVKDIEDIDGDKMYGGRTLPIVFGVQTAKITALLVGFVLITFISFVIRWENEFGSLVRVVYASIFITLPTIYSLYKLFIAKEKSSFRHVSQVIKMVMLAGLLYLIVLYFDTNL
jgi:4-hydroxybenzoate polyprenyltransferase